MFLLGSAHCVLTRACCQQADASSGGNLFHNLGLQPPSTRAAAAATAAPLKSFDPGYDFEEVEAALQAGIAAKRSSAGAGRNGSLVSDRLAASHHEVALQSQAEIALKQELGECEEWLDVLQIVQDETEVMTPACSAEALARYAHLLRELDSADGMSWSQGDAAAGAE